MMKKNRMKKYIAAAAVSAAVLGALTGCGSGKDIGRDAALEAALNDAGVSESETTRLKVSEDRDDGRKVYEIRFDVAEKEYDYEVLAADGSIISSEIDTNENYRPSSEETGSQGGTAAQDGSADQGASAGADTAQAQNMRLTVTSSSSFIFGMLPGEQRDVKSPAERQRGGRRRCSQCR